MAYANKNAESTIPRSVAEFSLSNGFQSHQCELFGLGEGGVRSEQFWFKTFFTTEIGFLERWYEQ